MSVLLHPVDSVASLLELDRVKPDAFLAGNPQIGWPRLYGGQVVAQALRAAGLTVDAPHRVHSLHAYFVRAGTESEPVLYEVERVRDGRSFTTRAVVAYQAGGAILNLIASFQAEEEGEDRQAIRPARRRSARPTTSPTRRPTCSSTTAWSARCASRCPTSSRGCACPRTSATTRWCTRARSPTSPTRTCSAWRCSRTRSAASGSR